MPDESGAEGRVLAERERGFAALALGERWEVTAALDGGYQQGALEVRRSDGVRGVFKAAPDGDSEAVIATKAAAIARARAAGWPAAAWLEWGATDGRPWFVQSFAEGQPIETFTRPLEQLVVEAVAAQEQLPARLPPFDWSAQVAAITEQGSYWHRRCNALGGRAASFARMLEAACATTTARDGRPPPQGLDLVHGDFATDNILEHDGRITIIDTQSVGRGCRAIDLASMAVHCLVWNQGRSSAQRFFTAAVDVAGSAATEYAASRALGVAVFAMDNYPAFIDTLATRVEVLEDFDGWR